MQYDRDVDRKRWLRPQGFEFANETWSDDKYSVGDRGSTVGLAKQAQGIKRSPNYL